MEAQGQQEADAEAAAAAAAAAASSSASSESAVAASGPGPPPPGCTSCEQYLDGQCNPANMLLYHVCKLRTGTRKEKEEAARQLGAYARESVRASKGLAVQGLGSLCADGGADVSFVFP